MEICEESRGCAGIDVGFLWTPIIISFENINTLPYSMLQALPTLWHEQEEMWKRYKINPPEITRQPR